MDSEELFTITEQENNDPPLTPSYHGKDCLGNGEHEDMECCCEQCDYYLERFPDRKEIVKEKSCCITGITDLNY